MADISTFANGIAHDLRNPLNVIRTNLYLLRQRVPIEDARAVRALDRIDDQVTASMRLLDGVQAFSRIEQPSFQRVNVNELTRDVLDTIPAPEGCEIAYEPAPEVPLVTADPHLLECALRALVANAVEAVATTGKVCVRTSGSPEHVRVEVQDSGPGVPEELLSRAFEPLFSTHRARSGLGLALVDRVARAHGGEAYLNSRPGDGTRAGLELPVG